MLVGADEVGGRFFFVQVDLVEDQRDRDVVVAVRGEDAVGAVAGKAGLDDGCDDEHVIDVGEQDLLARIVGGRDAAQLVAARLDGFDALRVAGRIDVDPVPDGHRVFHVAEIFKQLAARGAEPNFPFDVDVADLGVEAHHASGDDASGAGLGVGWWGFGHGSDDRR